eukprot:TRINITY_DN12407_c0_g4_i1.p1 TRINITY_DN12407_c0_g4~~TRINITY_DN12407_c0_g4_i1.p1  ORF type:complete len:120 (+),score=5.15 TRINITY_DN12407_c0_g4_i1:262-621(+)
MVRRPAWTSATVTLLLCLCVLKLDQISTPRTVNTVHQGLSKHSHVTVTPKLDTQQRQRIVVVSLSHTVPAVPQPLLSAPSRVPFEDCRLAHPWLGPFKQGLLPSQPCGDQAPPTDTGRA